MGKKKTVHVLYGPEQLLIDERLDEIIHSELGGEVNEFNLATFDMRDTPLGDALDEAETTPFLSERRLVIMKNPYFLSSNKEAETHVEHDLKRLEAYLHHPSPFATVIFVAPYDKLDKRKKIVTRIMKVAEVFRAQTPKQGELIAWVRKRSERLRVHITDEVIQELVMLVGEDLQRLHGELEKLALFVEEGNEITSQVVDLLIARSLEDNVFTLVNYVVTKQIDRALQTLRDLFIQHKSSSGIIALLARQFRMMIHVQELRRRGYSQKEMAAQLKLHPYAVQVALRQSRLFSEQDCFHMLHELAKADYLLKTGTYDDQLLLELVLSKVV